MVKKAGIKALEKTGFLKKMGREGFDEVIKKHASNGKTLDIGSGGNPYGAYFPNRVSVDIQNHPGVDVVADVHDLSQFSGNEFDTVLCTEALEHFYNPWKAMEEMTRVLKKGGTMILSTRFIFPLHEVPHDYYRFTEYGLRHLLRDYDILDFKASGGTMHTLGVLYQRIGYQADTLWFAPFKLIWFLHAKLSPLFSFVLTKEYGDVSKKDAVSHIMASGYIIVGKKKAI